MTQIEELFDMVTKQTEPDLGSWEEQERRQRQRSRRRRIGGFAVAAAIVAIGVVVATRIVGSPDPAPPMVSGPDDAAGVGDGTVPPARLAVNARDLAFVDLAGTPFAGVSGLPEDAAMFDVSRTTGQLVFVTTIDGNPQLATIPVTGGEMTVLPTEPAAFTPAWSPDGSRIAFAGDLSGTADLYVIDADGSGLQQLTDAPFDDAWPRWSPDGETIVYANPGPGHSDPQFSGTTDIWSVPADGGTPTQLTRTEGPDYDPDFSPDGSRIVYFHRDGVDTTDDGQIWVMDADGGNRELLIDEFGFTPRWSPDGTKVAFALYEPCCRPTVSFDGSTTDQPLLVVHVHDLDAGTTTSVADTGIVYEQDAPLWWSDDELVIRRVGY